MQQVGKRQGVHRTTQEAPRAPPAKAPESNSTAAETSACAQVMVKAAEGNQFGSARRAAT